MLVENSALLPDAIEEILRFRPPIMNYRRTALQDTELAGEQIKQGGTVICWFAAANRDETVFAKPDSFDVTRCQRESVRKDHRTFGFGAHHCLGFHLARLQLTVIFEQSHHRSRVGDGRGRRTRVLCARACCGASAPAVVVQKGEISAIHGLVSAVVDCICASNIPPLAPWSG